MCGASAETMSLGNVCVMPCSQRSGKEPPGDLVGSHHRCRLPLREEAAACGHGDERAAVAAHPRLGGEVSPLRCGRDHPLLANTCCTCWTHRVHFTVCVSWCATQAYAVGMSRLWGIDLAGPRSMDRKMLCAGSVFPRDLGVSVKSSDPPPGKWIPQSRLMGMQLAGGSQINGSPRPQVNPTQGSGSGGNGRLGGGRRAARARRTSFGR